MSDFRRQEVFRPILQPLTGAPAAAGGQWQQVGPSPLRIDMNPPRDVSDWGFQGLGPVSGEVTDLVVDPRGTTDQTIYIATNDGGIWKSTDGGQSWAPKTDSLDSLSMGAVALDPGNPDIVYAGTGNLFDGGGQFTKGVGIYRSSDGGDTWSIVGNTIFGKMGINRIVLPTSNVLLVATSNGLYRSIDGGQNFGANGPSFNDNQPVLSGSISDLRLDTALPSTTVYAAVSGQGLFKSTDAGVTFPANSNLFSNPGAPASPFGSITFAQSQFDGSTPNSSVFYASVQGGPSAYVGLYKSNDGGANWALLPAATARANADGATQTWYDLTVGVDPQNPQRVYIGFQELWLSNDGGNTFDTPACTSSQTHWDHHVIVFSPQTHRTSSPTHLFVGTDGGISTSNDGTHWVNLNEGIATNLFLGIDIGRGSTGNNQFTFGGMQDTGIAGHRPGDVRADWHQAIDGDGGPVAVDPSNPQNVYGSDDGSFIASIDGGASWKRSWRGEIGQNLPTAPAGTQLHPVVDPNNGSKIYVAAGNQLFLSGDTGATFASVHTFGGNVTSIAMTPLDSNRVWVGLDNGTIERTADAQNGAAANWSSFSTGVGGRAVTGVAINPSNSAHVCAVYSGFSAIPAVNRTQHVYQTIDDGATWNDIGGTDGSGPAGNVPDLPLHAVVINPNTSPATIVVAIDSGVMQTSNSGASWQILGSGLPIVDCMSLALDPKASPSFIRVGTYGRSVFELTLAGTPLPIVNGINPNSGPAAGGTTVTISGSGFTGATEVGFGATGSTSVTVNSDTQITAVSPAGTGTVDVTVVTPAGTSPTSTADQFTYNVGLSPRQGMGPQRK